MFPEAEEISTPVPYPAKLIPFPLAFIPFKVILPVVLPPRVKFWKLVVPKTPAPERKVALLPLLAEILAVGAPVRLLINANFALLVAVPPRSRSSVELVG